MRRYLAFTLIEVMICIAVIGSVGVTLTAMFASLSRSYHAGIRFHDMQSELDRTGYRVLALLEKNKAVRVGSNNRSLLWEDGQTLQWEQSLLNYSSSQSDYTLLNHVSHFSVFRRDALLILTLELVDPQSGRKRRSRYTWRPNHV